MSIDFDNAIAFPLNVTAILVARLKLLDSKIQVVNRGIRKADPNLTVGLYPESWQPIVGSEEFFGETGPAASIATLGEYYIQIHTLTKGMDQALSQRHHALLCRAVRDVVEYDQPLKVALESLPGVAVGNKTEYFKGFKALTQAYFPLDDASSTFVNVGALRCKITTETEIG